MRTGSGERGGGEQHRLLKIMALGVGLTLAAIGAAAVAAAGRRADSRGYRGVPGPLGATRLACHAAIPGWPPPLAILI